jgi:hypothetical protein
VNQEGKTRTLPNPLEMPIDGITCKWPSPLGRKHVTTIGKLPAQFAQCPDFVAAKRVDARLAILDAPDMQGGGPAELDLGPFKIANLSRPQPMPKSD